MQQPHFTLITGASLGLGKALALECAVRGMNLLLVALPHSGLEALASTIREEFGVDVHTLETDLCCAESCQGVMAFVEEKGLAVNVLINNLGGGSTELFAQGSLTQYEKQVELNVLSTIRFTYYFLPLLKRATPAYVLNVGSLAAYFTVPQKSVYAACKSFVLSFSKTLSEELRGSGVQVSVVCPSGMPTNAFSQQMIQNGSAVTRLSCTDPAVVARVAIDGLLRGKRVIVPRPINRFFLLVDKLLPLFFKRLLLGATMKRLKEKAQCNEPLPADLPVPAPAPNPATKYPASRR